MKQELVFEELTLDQKLGMLLCANIVADIIIRMTPDVKRYLADDGVLLASGIIAERCDDVVAAFEANGFTIVEKLTDNDWCGLAVRKA